MNTKHNTYLDLSKLSEEEIKEIKDLTYGYVDKISKYPLLFWDEIEWNQAEKDDQNYIPNLTEISLEEWKSMMNGGVKENVQVQKNEYSSIEIIDMLLSICKTTYPNFEEWLEYKEVMNFKNNNQ